MKFVISKIFTCNRHAHGPVNFTKYYAKARENCQTDVLYGRRTKDLFLKGKKFREIAFNRSIRLAFKVFLKIKSN